MLTTTVRSDASTHRRTAAHPRDHRLGGTAQLTKFGLHFPMARSPILCAHQMRIYNVRGFNKYDAQRDAPDWTSYLHDRQTALKEHAAKNDNK